MYFIYFRRESLQLRLHLWKREKAAEEKMEVKKAEEDKDVLDYRRTDWIEISESMSNLVFCSLHVLFLFFVSVVMIVSGLLLSTDFCLLVVSHLNVPSHLVCVSAYTLKMVVLQSTQLVDFRLKFSFFFQFHYNISQLSFFNDHYK
jgi:hypothetical protein